MQPQLSLLLLTIEGHTLIKNRKPLQSKIGNHSLQQKEQCLVVHLLKNLYMKMNSICIVACSISVIQSKFKTNNALHMRKNYQIIHTTCTSTVKTRKCNVIKYMKDIETLKEGNNWSRKWVSLEMVEIVLGLVISCKYDVKDKD